MAKLRFIIALWAAKSARLLLLLLGRNATLFPGKIAMKICPEFLRLVNKPARVIAVTGTNGKTTVCNMVVDILESSGDKVLNNRLGSNVEAGVVTSLLSGCTIFGRSKCKIAVFEIDERSSKRIYPYMNPDYIVITNLFRDSIMRNAHPEYIANIINESVPQTSKLILNGDDLISVTIAPGNYRVYFGIEEMDSDVIGCINLINDMQICPRCHGELRYDYRRYHHIGHAHCTECEFQSPICDYIGKNVDISAMTMTVSDHGCEYEYKLLSDSVFNIYNMITVIALLRELGMAHDEIAEKISKTGIVETRYHAENAGSIRVITQMAKDRNALAGSRAFDYVSAQPENKELILMMNNLGDAKKWSENVCWLYDCDFEFLNRENITRIVATGPRAKDYLLRLLLAGVPEEKLRCTLHEIDAPKLLELNENESVFIFYGTDAIGLAYQVRDQVISRIREEGQHDN